jgi:hypothetical protein
MSSLDYTKFQDGSQAGSSNERIQKEWWKSKNDTELAQNIASVLKSIAEVDGKRQTQYQISARLYGNADIMGINGLSYTKVSSTQNALRDRISYNVIQSCTDTITSKIAKNRPKPLFLTSGGDWKLKRKAQKLTKFIEGVFYENEVQKSGPITFRDACVLADGLTHVYAHEGRVKYERVFPSEIFVDWVDGFYGHPRQLHRVKNVDRQVLAEMFPDHKEKINEVNAATSDILGMYQNVADVVTVAESWHLPSGNGAKDGLHAITINGATLFKEKYDKPFFPFARMSWNRRLLGYWSQGLAESIQNIQLEINKLLWVIQRSMHLSGTFKIFVENSSKIVKEHLSNDFGSIIAYTGQQPTYLVPPIVPPEIYQHLLTLKNAAYEQCGISQLSATAQKPQGLNSGKALREYNDIETERFMTIGQAYENYHMDLAKLTISVAKDIYKEDKKFSVNVPGKKFIETIPWKDVDLEDDEFIMKVYPISSLPQDPTGRLQTVQEYVQAGFYSPRTAKRLLDFPDLEAVDDLQSAEEDYINKILEDIVDGKEYRPPEPDDNLQLCQELVLEYIAQGKRDGIPEDRLEQLRMFNTQTQALLMKAMPQAPQTGMSNPQAPAVPMQASDLVPQQAG